MYGVFDLLPNGASATAFQNRHSGPSLSEIFQLALDAAEQDGEHPHKDQVEHAGIEQGPHQAAAFHVGVAGEGQLVHGDDPGQRGILHQGDDLVGHGGHDALNHLQQGDLEENLALGQAQHLAGLPLAHRDPLDAAPINHGKVAGVVQGEGHHRGHHPPRVAAGPDVVAHDAGDVHKGDELEHQRRTPDNPDQEIAPLAQGGDGAHGAEGHHQPQGQGKHQGENEDLECSGHSGEQCERYV